MTTAIWKPSPPLTRVVEPVARISIAAAIMVAPVAAHLQDWLISCAETCSARQSSETKAETELGQIGALADNWDGYGAAAPHRDTISNVGTLLSAFRRQGIVPELLPNPNGTVSIEWAHEKGEAHIEIGRLRYVGMIRPTGSASIPVAGNVDTLAAAQLPFQLLQVRGDRVEGLHLRVMRLFLKRQCGEVPAGAISEFFGGLRLARIELEVFGERIEANLQDRSRKL